MYQASSSYPLFNIPLYASAHRLMHLGEDGTLIYADEFTRLNTEVLQMADEMFPLQGSTPEEEAVLCVSLLLGYNTSIYNNGEKEEKLQAIIDRVVAVKDQLSPSSLLKCQVLLYGYTVTFEEEWIEEAQQIINGWKGRPLTDDELEMMELYHNLNS